MIVETFRPEHFMEMEIQDRQSWAMGFVQPEHLENLAEYDAFTGIVDGKVVGCAGVVPMHLHRAHAWAVMSCDVGTKMISVHRAIRRYLAICPFKRIETSVEVDHKEGHRWARTLGFELEADFLKDYGENGAAHALYRWAG